MFTAQYLLFNVFKKKTFISFLLQSAGILVSTGLITEYFTFGISSELRCTPSVRCSSVANCPGPSRFMEPL
jgi:hypothetical protein